MAAECFAISALVPVLVYMLRKMQGRLVLGCVEHHARAREFIGCIGWIRWPIGAGGSL